MCACVNKNREPVLPLDDMLWARRFEGWRGA
jgi:hypothetical protein